MKLRIITWVISCTGIMSFMMVSAPLFGGLHRRAPLQPAPSPLRQYLADYEPSYGYQHPVRQRTDGVELLTTVLTSLAWRSPSEVDRPLWRHRLSIAMPERATSSNAVLIIEGGSSDSLYAGPQIVGGSLDLLKGLAKELSAPVVLLSAVPSQPLEFNGDGIKRSEDDLIAYSWAQFLKKGDPVWLAQFPMVKSAFTALSLAEELITQTRGHKPAGWMVTGASKRGWVTWLLAAMDPRVIGIAPLVIDVLNIVPSMQHHYAAYGFWAEAVKDYVNHGIMDQIASAEMHHLAQLIDPYSFRALLTMPKLIINAANDEFFLPDSSQFYFGDLPGKKYLRYVPNSGHWLNNPDILLTLTAFFRSLGEAAQPLPTISWRYRSSTLKLRTDRQPEAAYLWEAVNPEARDFRFSKSKPYPQYKATTLNLQAGKTTEVAITPPAAGWKSFFVELVFPSKPGSGGEETISLTTSAYVIGTNSDSNF